ncbi:hypothetical protein [Novosphingobium sp. AP12]|uniref:hypothetical protein n=1 Tax=Novosphingobium sp. AP12 TaxID=1144305 RepID=UPI000271D8D2|nr:hypothetical protein [Novosphingobium sp. AP12]EJL27566.1 hypothetical protein PMI02_02777 [Novosphingobium sp. AP12]
MIRAEIAFGALAERLAARAGKLAVARTADRVLASHKDESRWRRPGLVWPLFAKG